MPGNCLDPRDTVHALRDAGFASGTPVALAVARGGVGLAVARRSWAVAGDPSDLVRRVARELAPRWVWWSARSTAARLLADGVSLGGCWDLSAVHRLSYGGSADDPAHLWAVHHRLAPDGVPVDGQLDLGAGDPAHPVRPDGYLRPEWAEDGPASPSQAREWAALALRVHDGQQGRLADLPDRRRTPLSPSLPVLTAWSESGAGLLAEELAMVGLPLDRATAGRLIAAHAGERPADDVAAAAARARRDDAVRRHVPDSGGVDLRNPAQVRDMLARVGISVPDTRSWRLEPFRGAHPVIDALLAWRKSERVATTYGYSWLERHVGADGRLRGRWHGSDGAAGRMTAQAGLHNLPTLLREAVAAEPGHVLVRADLGQVEPRVLAAVSGDQALTAATADADLYAGVAGRLRCDRPTAKVAVLAAMYGQTTGPAGEALRGLERAYPVAMAHLRAADEEGRAGRHVRTYGGRLLRMWDLEAAEPAALAARGRFARNAVVQGAAAELFKMWAVTVRAGLAREDGPPLGQIVLCLHDELLVHVPERAATTVAALLRDSLDRTAARWAAGSEVRFVADVSVVRRWSDAKG